jgi:hypothetical protein
LSSAAPLVMGLTLKGDLDKIRFYSGIDYPYGIELGLFFWDRDDDTEQILGYGTVSDVRWMCDEGSGGYIQDDKLNIYGLFNSTDHVRFFPWLPGFADTSVQQHYRGRR